MRSWGAGANGRRPLKRNARMPRACRAACRRVRLVGQLENGRCRFSLAPEMGLWERTSGATLLRGWSTRREKRPRYKAGSHREK